MSKKYLLLFIIFLSIFSCKEKVSYDGVLIHRNDLPFTGYAPHYGPEEDIFIKTSISDSKFPDGVRYYLIYPKNGQYQNFKNNLGKRVKINGEEVYYFPNITIMVIENPDYEPNNKKAYESLDEYRLENAKIVKVY